MCVLGIGGSLRRDPPIDAYGRLNEPNLEEEVREIAATLIAEARNALTALTNAGLPWTAFAGKTP